MRRPTSTTNARENALPSKLIVIGIMVAGLGALGGWALFQKPAATQNHGVAILESQAPVHAPSTPPEAIVPVAGSQPEPASVVSSTGSNLIIAQDERPFAYLRSKSLDGTTWAKVCDDPSPRPEAIFEVVGGQIFLDGEKSYNTNGVGPIEMLGQEPVLLSIGMLSCEPCARELSLFVQSVQGRAARFVFVFYEQILGAPTLELSRRKLLDKNKDLNHASSLVQLPDNAQVRADPDGLWLKMVKRIIDANGLTTPIDEELPVTVMFDACGNLVALARGELHESDLERLRGVLVTRPDTCRRCLPIVVSAPVRTPIPAPAPTPPIQRPKRNQGDYDD